eukprot:scaffold64461_cov35-Tisochrysis_lutea.AAC.5
MHNTVTDDPRSRYTHTSHTQGTRRTTQLACHDTTANQSQRRHEVTSHGTCAPARRRCMLSSKRVCHRVSKPAVGCLVLI